MSNFDELCKFMSELKDQYSKNLYVGSGRVNSEDHTYYKSKVALLEMILHHAALMRKKDKETYLSPEDESGY